MFRLKEQAKEHEEEQEVGQEEEQEVCFVKIKNKNLYFILSFFS